MSEHLVPPSDADLRAMAAFLAEIAHPSGAAGRGEVEALLRQVSQLDPVEVSGEEQAGADEWADGGSPVDDAEKPWGHALPPDVARQLAHPAGRGWIPAERDIGLPGEAAGEAEWRFAAGAGDDALEPRPSALAFTPARQALFCDLLASCGNVRAVCGRVGVSAQTAYRQRRRDGEFSALWDAALVLARDHAEAVLAERALEGIEEPVFYHGEEVARRRRFDTRLLLAHLGRLDARFSARAEANAARFDTLLSQLGSGAQALPDRASWVEEQADAATREAMRAEYADAAWDDALDRDDGPDQVMLATARARADAGARWDAHHADACDWVDGLADRVDAADDAVPDDLPYEVKGVVGREPSATPVHPEPVSLRDSFASEGCAETAGLGESSSEAAVTHVVDASRQLRFRQAQDGRSLGCQKEPPAFLPWTVSPPVSLPHGLAGLPVESPRCGGGATGLPSA